MNKKNNDKIIETKLGILYWIDEEKGIVCGKTKPNVEITIDLLKTDFETYVNYFPHPHIKLLLNMSDMMGAKKEVRDFFAGSEGACKYFDALAVLVSSKYSVAGTIGYVALKVYPSLKPTQMFFNEEDAVNWLKSL